MKQPKINFIFDKNHFDHTLPLAFYRRSCKEIFVILPDWQNNFLQGLLALQVPVMRDSPIEKQIANAITHEYMHYLLHQQFDEKTCIAFDNIARGVDL